jgi:predicted patatin/cPLA2 family phospholipase
MNNKKAAVISGGGSWGAYGGGTLARINGDYDTIVGVSTGSLLAPLTILKEWDLLKEGYTTVTNNSVFDNYWYKPAPLSREGKLRKLPILISFIMGEKTICTSNSMRKTIDKFFPQEFFDLLKQQNKEILVGTQNYAQQPSKIHYFSSQTENYEDFKDWMWCSANFPFFTTLVQKSWKDCSGKFHVGLWSDGGLTDLVGLDQIMGKGYKEIDVILHRTNTVEKYEGYEIRNILENFTTSVNAMRYDIEFEYFLQKIQRLNDEGTKVTVYWLPRKLSANCMVFNKEEMTAWWTEGYETAFDEDRRIVFEPTNW